jgi:hypothetical protein
MDLGYLGVALKYKVVLLLVVYTRWLYSVLNAHYQL